MHCRWGSFCDESLLSVASVSGVAGAEFVGFDCCLGELGVQMQQQLLCPHCTHVQSIPSPLTQSMQYALSMSAVFIQCAHAHVCEDVAAGGDGGGDGSSSVLLAATFADFVEAGGGGRGVGHVQLHSHLSHLEHDVPFPKMLSHLSHHSWPALTTLLQSAHAQRFTHPHVSNAPLSDEDALSEACRDCAGEGASSVDALSDAGGDCCFVIASGSRAQPPHFGHSERAPGYFAGATSV